MKMRPLFFFMYVIILFILMLLWSKITPLIQIFSWIPNIAVLITFLAGHIIGRRFGILTGAYLGLIEDFMTGFFGFGLLSKTLTGFISGHFFRVNESYNQINFVYGLLTACFVNGMIYNGLYFYSEQEFSKTLAQFVAPETVYTLAMGFFIYYI